MRSPDRKHETQTKTRVTGDGEKLAVRERGGGQEQEGRTEGKGAERDLKPTIQEGWPALVDGPARV